MELVAATISSAVVETGRFVFGFYPNIKNFIKFQSNHSELEKEMKSLLDLKNKVKEEVESPGTTLKDQIIEWLGELEQILPEVSSLQAGMVAHNEKVCSNLFNCCERYKHSSKTARILKEVDRLLKAGNSIAAKMVVVNYLGETVEHIPGPSIENQTTASQNLAKVMHLLNDDNVRLIGVWGMGGVGKTTLVKNLNNKLKSASSTQQFGKVIWATVSKQLDLKGVQMQIANRLNLEVKMGESMDRLAIRLHQSLRKEKKFLLILDDVWETIDLDCLGIPQPEIHKGSKIIWTARSLDVCREMKSDVEVKVDVLDDEEAWQLFIRNAGSIATSEHIQPFAKAICRECSGLPLAIITVGAAMRGKKMIELWKDALNELQKSVPCIRGIQNKVYKSLKWSYDSLQGKNIKSCFLYCSLYPEDFSIDISELLNCWLGEGLIDEQQNYEDTHNRGIALIESLKDSCLLEDGPQEGTVKMHDVVRDVAIWISEDECKSLVRSGIGLSQISETEISVSLKRVSFASNKLEGLPDGGIHCPEALTLLLQGNINLERIPDGFLQAFQSLMVLNIGGACIRSLPQSVLQLGDLKVLILKGCRHLEEISPVGELRKLQVLDCYASGIRELPSGMENLTNLKELNISFTFNLKSIPCGIISRLSCLEVLDMTKSAYVWDVKQEAKDGETSFEELCCLERLRVLYIELKSLPLSLGQEDDLTWTGRLRTFQLCIGPRMRSWDRGERMVKICSLDLSSERVGWFFTIASSLILDYCEGLNQMLETLVVNRIDCFAGLKCLTITRSTNNLRLGGGASASHGDLLPNIEELHLGHLIKLESISELVGHLGLRFSKLKFIEVIYCPRLQHLLTCGGNATIHSMPNLERIKINDCENLMELFKNYFDQNLAPEPVVPNLRILKLKNLPKLSSLNESWQTLEEVEVIGCDILRKLHLTTQNADKMKEIRGELEWWNQLEWEDNDTKSSLLPCFNEVKLDDIWRTILG